VVACALLANHVPLNPRNIGANEHESPFVVDVLFNNATDILPAIHSTSPAVETRDTILPPLAA
jgi:hypothetical protein